MGKYFISKISLSKGGVNAWLGLYDCHRAAGSGLGEFAVEAEQDLTSVGRAEMQGIGKRQVVQRALRQPFQAKRRPILVDGDLADHIGLEGGDEVVNHIAVQIARLH